MIYDLIETVNEQVEAELENAPCVRADKLGMDRRAGYSLYVLDGDGLVVAKSQDGTLQYYGGFEYVDKACRIELGDWVYYSNEDERVQDCLDYFEEHSDESE